MDPVWCCAGCLLRHHELNTCLLKAFLLKAFLLKAPLLKAPLLATSLGKTKLRNQVQLRSAPGAVRWW